MKVAVLIIAHGQMQHLIKLLESLDSTFIDVYLHADKKWKDFDPKHLQSKFGNLFICNERFSGQLDTFRLIDISLQLLKDAKTNGKYDYFWLMSGVDFLLQNPKRIAEELTSLYPKILMDCTPYDRNNWINAKVDCIFSSRWHALILDSVFSKKMKHYLNRLLLILERTFTKILGTPYSKLKKLGIEAVYGGSAWWILPDVAIEYILKYCDDRPKVISAFKQVRTIEELFFQTVLMTSPMSSEIELNDINERLQNCKTYAYFTDAYGKEDAKKPFKGHPYIFTMEDIDLIKQLHNDGYFAARKFSQTDSQEVVAWINKNLIDDEKYCFEVH